MTATSNNPPTSMLEPRGRLMPTPAQHRNTNSLLNIGSLDDAMRAAELMSKSGLVPQAFRGKPADILVAMQWGAEMGIQPMQAINSISVIQGKPSIYGDLGKALIMRRTGIDLLDYTNEVTGDAMQRHATCKIERANPNGKPLVCERSFSMEDAKRASLLGKGPWLTYPDRMLTWRAFWLCARDIYADVLGGIQGGEEMEDWRRSEETHHEPVHVSAASRVVAAAKIEAPKDVTTDEPPTWSREDMVGEAKPDIPEAVEKVVDAFDGEVIEVPDEPVPDLNDMSPFKGKRKDELIALLSEAAKEAGFKVADLIETAKGADVPYTGGRPSRLTNPQLVDLIRAVWAATPPF
jgi:hypothetical protein